MPEADSPALLSGLRAERAEREAAERLRLLYVAMTRARCWLVAAGAGKVTKEATWHRLISAGVMAAGSEELEGGILRHSHGSWPAPLRQEVPQAPLPALPDWASRPAPEPLCPAAVLSPSDLGGPKALPGEAGFDTEDSKRRGTALHLLLERLPGLDPATWAAHAEMLIPDPAHRAAALAEAGAVLSQPELAALFGPDSLAEVALTAPWQGRILAGSIDRLILTPDRALIVDYKSNAVIPDRAESVPEGLLRQLGAYAHMVGQICPGRHIETAILWTRAPRLMPVDPEIVRQALARATIP